jgi:hypothetical protein
MVLLWLFLVLSFLALPGTWSLPDAVSLSNSCLLNIPGVADTVSSPRRYARTTDFLLTGISFQMEALDRK